MPDHDSRYMPPPGMAPTVPPSLELELHELGLMGLIQETGGRYTLTPEGLAALEQAERAERAERRRKEARRMTGVLTFYRPAIKNAVTGSSLETAAKLTMLTLIDLADRQGYVTISRRALARVTGITERQAMRHLRALTGGGWLIRRGREGEAGPNIYLIDVPARAALR